MIKLAFNVFQDKLAKEQFNGHFPIVHCMIDDERFVFLIKSQDKWEYYTIMSFETITLFAQEQGENPLDALMMFKTTYCANVLYVEDIHMPLMTAVINEQEEEQEEAEQVEGVEGVEYIKRSANDILFAGDDIVEEAENYSDFLEKFFGKMETKILRAVQKIDTKLDKAHVEKTLGEFLRDLFNGVNTVAFAKIIRKYLKQDMIAGLQSAEAELNLDIGFTEKFSDKLNVLSSQQIDGYTINGRKWPGIKGVTKEIQSAVIKVVQEGLNNNLSVKEVTHNVQTVFSTFSESRAARIARTETTRIICDAKQTGYEESQLSGDKVWSSAQPRGCANCSEICDRLDGQVVPLNQQFFDSVTGVRYDHPPAHPHCKSTFFFRPHK